MSEQLPFLPYGKQAVSEDDVAAVCAVLKSDYLTTGPEVPRFEGALCSAIGAAHSVAVSNGTAALHAACFAAEIGPGDEVLVPAITFVASANCVRYLGGEPIFVDVHPDSGLIDLDDAQRKITSKTKAVIPVHLNGRPADLDALSAIAQKHGLTVIEDAAHALGAKYRDSRIGDCTYSDMAIFSFHPVKHITTAEGGSISTGSDVLATRLRQFRDHGIERRFEHMRLESPPSWYYEQHTLGFNYRLSAIQCVLGTSQLTRLSGFIERRNQIAAFYDRAFEGVSYVTPAERAPATDLHAYHLYPLLIDYDGAGTTREGVVAGLRERRIGTQVHYIPVPAQPYYSARGWKASDFPGAAAYYARALSIPMYPTLSDDDVKRVVEAVSDVLSSGT
ncbi:MAG: UDP-4-amino-4,6-dideoxy-N-acetyl-beta-L-altrosamine transaminase [Myxococcales bacterium]|nr:UDP-4-amino-4,6-dideoxy-N-acetyl-beta-L-altrosamine transaminase [Myxococcales bacterium]